MTASFYLFNVDHGQCAALRLPNGRWCIFDLGSTSTFSPVRWIVANDPSTLAAQALGGQPNFRFLKGTVSHLHGDHLADYTNLIRQGPAVLTTVGADHQYLQDSYATCSNEGVKASVREFTQHYSELPLVQGFPDYGGASIAELSLPVAIARELGGDANARVNNASIVTRICVHGNTILLCGDVQGDAWDAVLTSDWRDRQHWVNHVSNVDILVAPHHGHTSGYSIALLRLSKPIVVLVSARSRDTNVDNRYSQSPVRGMTIDWQDGAQTTHSYISTRDKGHIRVDISPPANHLMTDVAGQQTWTFGRPALL